MAYPDLQTFLQTLDKEGELRRVKQAVDPELEITEIATRVVKEAGPALLFERVKGSQYPVAINTLGNWKRIELALGRHPQEFGEDLVQFIERLNPPSLKALWASRDVAQRLLAARATTVSAGICQEVVESQPDLSSLPILKCWPQDGGRFLTLPLVYTEDPVTRRSNLGIYRMQVYSNDTTGMHWQIQKGGGFHYFQAEKLGKPLEGVVALGGDPALLLAAVMPLPEALAEVMFAGLLRGSPTRMVACRNISLRAPANAEFVLEGVVAPQERQEEGPFGDHFGHYSERASFPVFHIKAITRRKDAIYPAAVVGKPPQEDRYLGDAVQEILRPLIKLMRPEVRDLWAYYQAGFHNLLVVAVEGRYTKEPMKTALGLLGEGQLSLTKCLVLVDADVNVRDFPAVLRAIRHKFTPQDDFLLLSRVPLDTLDFTSFKMHLGSKMVIDATSKPGVAPRELPSPVMQADPKDLCPEALDWRLLDDTLLAVRVQGPGQEAVSRLVHAEGLANVPIIATVSADVDLKDDVNLLWGIFTRFDPARDVQFTNVELHGIQPTYRGVMGIDATWKPGYPGPLVMSQDIIERVDRQWDQYWKR